MVAVVQAPAGFVGRPARLSDALSAAQARERLGPQLSSDDTLDDDVRYIVAYVPNGVYERERLVSGTAWWTVDVGGAFGTAVHISVRETYIVFNTFTNGVWATEVHAARNKFPTNGDPFTVEIVVSDAGYHIGRWLMDGSFEWLHVLTFTVAGKGAEVAWLTLAASPDAVVEAFQVKGRHSHMGFRRYRNLGSSSHNAADYGWSASDGSEAAPLTHFPEGFAWVTALSENTDRVAYAAAGDCVVGNLADGELLPVDCAAGSQALPLCEWVPASPSAVCGAQTGGAWDAATKTCRFPYAPEASHGDRSHNNVRKHCQKGGASLTGPDVSQRVLSAESDADRAYLKALTTASPVYLGARSAAANPTMLGDFAWIGSGNPVAITDPAFFYNAAEFSTPGGQCLAAKVTAGSVVIGNVVCDADAANGEEIHCTFEMIDGSATAEQRCALYTASLWLAKEKRCVFRPPLPLAFVDQTPQGLSHAQLVDDLCPAYAPAAAAATLLIPNTLDVWAHLEGHWDEDPQGDDLYLVGGWLNSTAAASALTDFVWYTSSEEAYYPVFVPASSPGHSLVGGGSGRGLAYARLSGQLRQANSRRVMRVWCQFTKAPEPGKRRKKARVATGKALAELRPPPKGQTEASFPTQHMEACMVACIRSGDECGGGEWRSGQCRLFDRSLGGAATAEDHQAQVFYFQ